MAIGIPPLTLRPAGSRITAAIYEQDITDSLNFLTNPPIFRGVQNTIQSVPNSAWASIGMDSSVVDTYSGHSNVTNNSRYTPTIAGYYTVGGVVSFASNATGFRGAAIAVNGANLKGGVAWIAPLNDICSVPAPTVDDVFLNGTGDYVELRGAQGSGGALNTLSTTDVASSFWVRFSHA